LGGESYDYAGMQREHPMDECMHKLNESLTREIKIRLCNSIKEKGSHIGLEMKAGLIKRSVQAFH
jgi:hypothetical protein